MDQVKPHATSVFVPALLAGKAIEEAIEAEVPLIVSVAEHIPVHDMLRVQEMLRTQSKSRLVGPNCPGIIAPEQCRIGIMPYKQYKKGKMAFMNLTPAVRQIDDTQTLRSIFRVLTSIQALSALFQKAAH